MTDLTLCSTPWPKKGSICLKCIRNSSIIEVEVLQKHEDFGVRFVKPPISEGDCRAFLQIPGGLQERQLNIYFLEGPCLPTYDHYVSFVVFAESAEKAIDYAPDGGAFDWNYHPTEKSYWANTKDQVTVTHKGVGMGVPGEIICAVYFDN